MNTHFPSTLLAGLLQAAFAIQGAAFDRNAPASPEVTAAMQPYLDSCEPARVAPGSASGCAPFFT